MTKEYIKASKRCLPRLIKARNLLRAKVKDLYLADVFKAIHYCLSQGINPIGYGNVGDACRPSSILELMPFINRKVSEAALELGLLEVELTKRINEISRDIENYNLNR